jgi:hypothetical protein
MFNTIATQVRLSTSSESYKIYARFSEDESHVPVLLTSKVRGGEIRAELAGSMIVEPPAPTATPAPTPRPAPTTQPTIPETPVPSDENWPFSVGEELNYRVFLGESNATAGTVTFQVRGRSRYFNRNGLLFTVKAQTTGTIARLFVANDQISTYVDPKTLLPYRTELNLSEGKRKKNQTLTINQDNGTLSTGGKTIQIPVGTHDYLSFFYALRTFNLTPQRRNAISILVEDGPKTLAVNAGKREIISLGEQKIPAIPLSLTTPDDRDNDKYQLRIWVSDDRRRLPLRITAKTEIGAVRADLVILPTTSQ